MRKDIVFQFRQALESVNFSAVSDAALVFGMLGLAELAIAGQGNLAALKPHPFWIPVLYLTVKHGSRAGLGTAAFATILFLLFIGPERLPDQDFYSYSLRAHIDPAMWLVAALILGSFIDRYHSEKASLEASVRTTLSDREDIARYCQRVSARLCDMERQRLSNPDDAVDVAMAAFVALQDASQDRSMDAVQELATVLFGPCVVAEHDVDAAARKVIGSQILVRRGGFSKATAYEISDNVIDQLQCSTDCLSILHEEGSEAEGPFVFACSLRDSSSVCRSILCLQEVDPGKIAPWAEFAFKQLALALASNRYPAGRCKRLGSDCKISNGRDGVATWH